MRETKFSRSKPAVSDLLARGAFGQPPEIATGRTKRSEALSPRGERAPKEAILSRRLGVRHGGRVCRPAELREQLVGLGLLGKRGIQQHRRVGVAELLRP